MTKAKYSFTVTAILDAANTIEAADKLRGLLESNGFEQTSCECGGVTLGPKTVRVITERSCCGDPDCDCPCCEEDDDTHHVFTLRCNAHDCYNTIDVTLNDHGRIVCGCGWKAGNPDDINEWRNHMAEAIINELEKVPEGETE